MWGQLAVSLQQGNGYIIAVLVLGFFGTVILLERYLMLNVVYNINFAKFLANIKKTIQAEDMDRAVNLCKSASHTGLPFISLRALEAAETDPSTVRGTIEEETIDFLPRIEARLGTIPALSTLILLIGIMGTIDGLWGAFDSIEVLDTSEKQARLAHGIAGSLNTTTMALITCMIFLAAHQILRGTAIKLTERVYYGVTVLHNLLVPQEVATYMPVVDASGPASSSSNNDYAASDSVAPAAKEEADDNFDDASVEDIKDEEEII